MEIWINPACSKCQSALTILDAEEAEYTVRHYLEDPPTVSELEDVLRRLGLEPWDLAREREQAEFGLDSWPRNAENRDRWVQALADNPILIQRPLITVDDTTVIARSPEAVRNMLGN